MPNIKNIVKEKDVNVQFSDVRDWFDKHMLVDNIDLDDQEVYKVYEQGKWVGIFQCTSHGAQKFFEQAKPKSIADIAVLTSIYRPGPLAAKVNDLWIEALQGAEYDWGDKRINKLLEKTKGLLIFQEGVMHLAEHVAGFPKDKCDEVRRAIMKRSISGGDAAKAKVDEMKSQFVEGAVKNGYAEDVASELYEKIAYFSGYAFNSSHAFSYGIDSFYCAWMLTHYPDKWCAAYLESMSNNPEDRARAFGEVKSLGYQFVPIDINYATQSWTILEGKRFMPSFLSCKSVGASAISEILLNRPYKSIEDLLWNEDGSWRHSKFNKRALEALIKMRAFGSLDCIGENRVFSSYRHMHHVIIENMDKIKKSTKKEPRLGQKNFYEIARETYDQIPEWTNIELMQNMVEVTGSLDVSQLISDDLLRRLNEKEIKPIDLLEEGDKDIVWFIIQSFSVKKTKNGKEYGQVEALGPSGKPVQLKVWGCKGTIQPLTLYLAEVDKNQYGCSTNFFKLKKIANT